MKFCQPISYLNTKKVLPAPEFCITSMFSSCALIGTSIHNLNAHQFKFFNQFEKKEENMCYIYCVFYDDELPCKHELILYLQFQSFFRYHVCTIKLLINKRVCDHVTYSTSIVNSFQPRGKLVHDYLIPSFCLYEKCTRPLGELLVQNQIWRGKSNASIFKLSGLFVRARACVCVWVHL